MKHLEQTEDSCLMNLTAKTHQKKHPLNEALANTYAIGGQHLRAAHHPHKALRPLGGA